MQRHQPIRDPRRYNSGNEASGCSEDSSPQEGASSPPLSAADPPHSWSPSTASATEGAGNRGQGQGQERRKTALRKQLSNGEDGEGLWGIGSNHPSSQDSRSLIVQAISLQWVGRNELLEQLMEKALGNSLSCP